MSPPAKSIFIAGAHTDVGKTYVSAALIRAARRAGMKVRALKPVVSGFDETDWAESDPGRLLAALGEAPTPEALGAMSPWRYVAPQSPPLAARLQGQEIVLTDVAAWCRARMAEPGADLTVLEGVGGLMSPLTERETGLDLMTALAIPAVLVTGTYLGAISHALTALAAARAAGVRIIAIVASESPTNDAPFAPTLEALEAFSGLPVIAARRDAGDNFADELLRRLA